MEKQPGTLAALPKALSVNQAGKSLQPSEQGALAPCLTEHEQLLYENYALKALIEGLVYMTCNPDAVYLAVMRATKTCQEAKIPPQVCKKIIETVKQNFKKTTRKNPLSQIF